MTDKKSNSKLNKPAKPPISKVSTAQDGDIEEVIIPKVESKVNGPAAEVVSQEREVLLRVDTYQEAEQVLSENPDLIEQARVVFGAIVPTSGQNKFMDLAITAAAEDDATDLRSALETKRETNLNLTTPEIEQLLEFADEQATKSPVLALNTALLLTDDLTHLEEQALWQKQKEVILTVEREIGLDATALWDVINEEPVQEIVKVESEATSEPTSKVVKTKVKTPKPKKHAPPPPYVRHKSKKQGGPPRWLLASGFIFTMSMFSCGACMFEVLFF